MGPVNIRNCVLDTKITKDIHDMNQAVVELNAKIEKMKPEDWKRKKGMKGITTKHLQGFKNLFRCGVSPARCILQRLSSIYIRAESYKSLSVDAQRRYKLQALLVVS